MLTRDEYLEKMINSEKPKCPHCGAEMSIWEVPPMTFSDGLGWGEPFLFICFNDECPPFVSGWAEIEENYGHIASYRCINYPFSDKFELMPVFGKSGGSGQVITEETLSEQEKLKERTKTGFSILADCYVNKDFIKMLSMLTDSFEPTRVRLKAAEMLGDIADVIEVIEPMRNMKAPNKAVQDTIDEALLKIHNRCFTKECPFCAEIIKRKAKICKHCNKDVAGL